LSIVPLQKPVYIKYLVFINPNTLQPEQGNDCLLFVCHNCIKYANLLSNFYLLLFKPNKQQAKNKIIHTTLSMEITIIIQPISFELTVYLLSSLEQRLSKAFDAIIKA
jgi:hypothetical protein